MIRKIKDRRKDYNNDENISKSPLKSNLKIIYYQIILYLYKFIGLTVTKNKIQANSSWTYGHMT